MTNKTCFERVRKSGGRDKKLGRGAKSDARAEYRPCYANKTAPLASVVGDAASVARSR